MGDSPDGAFTVREFELMEEPPKWHRLLRRVDGVNTILEYLPGSPPPQRRGCRMPHPDDVEVFLRDCPVGRAVDWVRAAVGPLLAGPFACGSSLTFHLAHGTVVLTPDIGGGPFLGVWFNTLDRPWATDADCARAASASLGCVARCDPGDDIPGVSPLSDSFLEVDGESERLLTWEEGPA